MTLMKDWNYVQNSIEELKREDEYIKSGGKMWTLEEVAKELGIKLKLYELILTSNAKRDIPNSASLICLLKK